jgi:hypothetical protein
MVLITAAAQAQLEALESYCAKLGRDLAAVRMAEAVSHAASRIEAQAGPFWTAPRPYPELSWYGWQWLKVGRYWIAFTPIAGGHAITGVFFETANIPRRLSRHRAADPN